VLNILEKEQPDGVIVQFGGQTPLNLAHALDRAGAPIIGTTPQSIDRAEDRKHFKELLQKLGLVQPPNDTATSVEEARRIADRIGYPVVLRPSFVLGGRAMVIVYEERVLKEYMERAVEASPDKPILIDKFVEDAVEIDVDAIADGRRCVIGGIQEHIEEAGIHSGDSACVLPAFSLAEDELHQIRENTYALARELNVVGLLNVQYAIKNDVVHVLEVNPRASRTVPFVSKAIGVARATLEELGFTEEVVTEHVAVKYPVFPFAKLPGVDTLLGPEMRSTGEVMGIDTNLGAAFAKAYIAAGHELPLRGRVFLSVKNRDKREVVFIAKYLDHLGFRICATEGTARVLRRSRIEPMLVHRVSEQGSPNAIDLIREGEIQLIINTPSDKVAVEDQRRIRHEALKYNVPSIATTSGAAAAVMGIEAVLRGDVHVRPLQEYHQAIRHAQMALLPSARVAS
jgi:carbamoyl-phosphate synthase large subunit